MGKRFSAQEQQYLKDNFESKTIVEIAKDLERRPDFVGGWARKLGLRKLEMVPWTTDEEDIIRKYFPEWGVGKCIKYLPNRTKAQIHWKAKRLGIYCNITKHRINLGIKHNDFETNKSYSNGYIVIKVNGKLRTEQSLLAEQVLGRSLTTREVVHHINEVKDDNRLENLAVLTRSDHVKLHRGDTTINIVPLSKLIKR